MVFIRICSRWKKRFKNVSACQDDSVGMDAETASYNLERWLIRHWVRSRGCNGNRGSLYHVVNLSFRHKDHRLRESQYNSPQGMKRREGREMALAEGVRPGRITRDSERALAP